MSIWQTGVTYSLVTDITGTEKPRLKASPLMHRGVPKGTTIIVNADSGYKSMLDGKSLKVVDPIMQNLVVTVE